MKTLTLLACLCGIAAGQSAVPAKWKCYDACTGISLPCENWSMGGHRFDDDPHPCLGDDLPFYMARAGKVGW